MRKIRILIVDDSAVVRKSVSTELTKDADIVIAGVAANGRIALAMIDQVSPDVIILDVQMPEMDGLTFLQELRIRQSRIPVIMLSSVTKQGAETTLQALALGAQDYVTKPEYQTGFDQALASVCGELLPKIKEFCKHLLPPAGHTPSLSAPPSGAKPSSLPSVVVIGVSTGGPSALSQLIPVLAADFPVPILLVQHMPPMFTKMLAERLGASSKVKVQETQGGEVLKPGNVYLAAGGFHLEVEKTDKGVCTKMTQAAPVNSCRPSADVLFESAVKLYGKKTLAVVMTGMGEDGKRGCESIVSAGGFVVAQDEATSVVWGMPGAVVRAGLAGQVLPLTEIAATIERYCSPGARK